MTTPAQILTTPAQTYDLEIELALDKFQIDQRANGRAGETIRSRLQSLRQVAKICNLNNLDIVKIWLSDKENKGNFPKVCTWSNKTKVKFVDTYAAYLRFMELSWTPPNYTVPERLPFIPTEEEIDALIASCGTLTATVLQALKETGMRIGELTQITPTDIDTQRKTISVTAEKGSNPRILPISDKLIGMIMNLPKDSRATYKTVFQPHKDTLRDYLSSQRKIAAQKLNNPRLMKISFHTFRHWKGTMLYLDFPDMDYVRKFLGHKSILSTQVYVNIAQALFTKKPENYICKAAHNEQEEIDLINKRFQHVNNRGDTAFYKKRA